MKKTYHAEKRMCQRALNDSSLEIVLRLGRIENLPGGVTGRFFGNREYDKAMISLKNIQKMLDRAKNTRVIVDDATVITLYKNDNMEIMAS